MNLGDMSRITILSTVLIYLTMTLESLESMYELLVIAMFNLISSSASI